EADPGDRRGRGDPLPHGAGGMDRGSGGVRRGAAAAVAEEAEPVVRRLAHREGAERRLRGLRRARSPLDGHRTGRVGPRLQRGGRHLSHHRGQALERALHRHLGESRHPREGDPARARDPRGRTLPARGAKLSNYFLSFTEPWFRDTPTLLGFSVYNSSTQLDLYRERRIGASGKIGRPLPWPDFSRGSVSYRLEDVTIDQIDTAAVART